jgi:hypothetical protein
VSENIIVTFHELNAQVLSLSKDSPRPNNINLNILDLFENLIAWRYEGFQYLYSNNIFCGLIGKIEVDRPQNRINLVFVVADADADPQCVRDLSTNAIRILHRKTGEAVEKRVHVVFKIDPTMPFMAKVAMEHERGVSTKILVSTLNYLFRDARVNNTLSKPFFVGEHPVDRYVRGANAGQPMPLKYKVNFEYESVLSDEIIDAFVNGRIKNVEFSKPANYTQRLDNQGLFHQDHFTVNLKMQAINIPSSQPRTRASLMQYITAPFKELVSNNPDLAQTTFKIKFLAPSGSTQLAEYDSQTDAFTLVKKAWLSKTLRQPMTDVIQLNTVLCDRIFSKI